MSSPTGNFTCPADNRTFPDTEAIQFHNTGTIIRNHENTPRFGHSSNITSVIEYGSKEEGKDYLIGILSASIAMFIFFLLWISFLLICKCLGYKLVGFLSGSRVRIPPPPKPSSDQKDGIMKQEEDADGGLPAEPPADSPVESGGDVSEEKGGKNDEAEVQVQGEDAGGQKDTEDFESEQITSSASYEQDLESWRKAVKVRENRQRRIRIVVLFCGLVIVVMCILMIVYGINSLIRSFYSARNGLRKAEDLAYTGVEIIDNFMESNNRTMGAARTIDSSDLCAPVADAVCQSLQPGEDNCIPNDDIQAFLEELEDSVSNELLNMRSDLNETAELLGALNDKIGQYIWAFWVSAGAAALLALLTICIMSGVILAWQNKLHGNYIQKFASCIRGWFIVPIFIFLVIIGWLLSMVFVIGSTASADMCYNSPDANVLVRILRLLSLFLFSASLFSV